MSVSRSQIRPHLLFTSDNLIQFRHLGNAGGPPFPLQEHQSLEQLQIPPSLEPTRTAQKPSLGFDSGGKPLLVYGITFLTHVFLHLLHPWIFFWNHFYMFVISYLVKIPVVAPFIHQAWSKSHVASDTLEYQKFGKRYMPKRWAGYKCFKSAFPFCWKKQNKNPFQCN